VKALVFLDMDGVIADFVGGITSLHGRPSPYSDPKNFGEFHMDKIWGMTAEEFWAPLNRINSFDFWANLNPTPEAHDIVDLLSSRYGVENVCILTSPTLDSGCVPGKRAWTERHFPQLAKNMLFGSAKQFLAGPGRIPRG
jgi:5'(3')-deoxyribonucleotidase